MGLLRYENVFIPLPILDMLERGISMEKRKLKLSDLVFVVATLTAIICMFLNWLPVELNLGTIQLSDVFGNINALNFRIRLGELEESIGRWGSLLPEEFENVKNRSTLVALSAGLTILAYVSTLVLRAVGEKRYVQALTWLAGIGTIVTHTGFCSVIEGIADYVGLSTVGYDVLENVRHSPCTIMLICGIVSICCTEAVTDVLANLADSLIAAIVNVFMIIGEGVQVVINNIGYLTSDVIGGVVGIYVGIFLNSVLGSTVLVVIVGLTTAGLVAYACMKIFDLIFGNKESLV